jgi:hypothetical protein
MYASRTVYSPIGLEKGLRRVRGPRIFHPTDYARRKAIHKKEFRSPLSTHLFVQRFMADIEEAKAVCKSHIPVRSQPDELDSQWTPPPEGFVKVKSGRSCI